MFVSAIWTDIRLEIVVPLGLAGSAIGSIAGIVINRPAKRAPFVWFASASIVSIVVAQAWFHASESGNRVAFAGAISAFYVAQVGAILAMIRSHSHLRRPPVVLEVLIFALGVFLFIYEWSFQAIFSSNGISEGDQVGPLLFVLGDLCLLGALLRFALTSIDLIVARILMVLAAAVIVVADVPLFSVVAGVREELPRLWTLSLVGGFLLQATALLHPSMKLMVEESFSPEPVRARTVYLGAAGVLAVSAILREIEVQGHVHGWIMVGGLALLMLLYTGRFVLVTNELWRERKRLMDSQALLRIRNEELRILNLELETKGDRLEAQRMMLKSALDESHELEVRLREMAFHDPLTGLANRKLWVEHVGRALSRTARSERLVAVAYVDLDGFKDVNDSFGHAAGDLVLAEAAERILASVRSADVVARLGGDEFVVLMEGISDEEAAAHVARRILLAFRTPVLLGGSYRVISASIGIAFALPHDDTETLLHRADVAMYEAKESGKNRYVAHRA